MSCSLGPLCGVDWHLASVWENYQNSSLTYSLCQWVTFLQRRLHFQDRSLLLHCHETNMSVNNLDRFNWRLRFLKRPLKRSLRLSGSPVKREGKHTHTHTHIRLPVNTNFHAFHTRIFSNCIFVLLAWAKFLKKFPEGLIEQPNNK